MGTCGRAAGLAALLMGLAACGDDDIGIGPTPTVTVTRTATAVATRTPTTRPTNTPVGLAGVEGLVVVDRAVSGDERDGLRPLPADLPQPDGSAFDRGLGDAAWVVDDGDLRGDTDDDGRFRITGLTPGRHALRFTKTVDGNLMQFVVPIIVGDDGSADVVAEVSWGLVRATSTYTAGGAAMRAVFAPNGTSVIARGTQLVELSDGWRTFVDGDGDGRFDPQGCGQEIYACDDRGGCATPDDVCVCVPSCPDCQDCARNACVPRTVLQRPECGPDGLCGPLPYLCGDGGTCGAGDQCTCVSSCLGCDNCESFACVAPCQATEPIELLRVDVAAPASQVLGRPGQARAVALLSDGSALDATFLVEWASSEPAVATVDGWGTLTTAALGRTDLTASLGAAPATPHTLEVVERPSLRRIWLQKICAYPLLGLPDDSKPLPPAADAFLPPPNCGERVRIGATIPLNVIGEFDDGSYEDLAAAVTWTVDPAAVGAVANGVFTAAQTGTATITASLDGVVSDAIGVTVVEQASLVSLAIYPGDYPYLYADGGPVRPGDALPCFECGYYLTLLIGDVQPFRATAHYDTGEWEDVTDRVAWRSSAAGVVAIDAAGQASAAAAGDAQVEAALDGITSAPVAVRVVAEATLQALTTYMEGADRAIGKGAQAVFHAVGYYDVGFSRDVTEQVVWKSSDESVGGFDAPGIFTGRAAGNVTVWAELDGQQSAPLPLEVFALSDVAYCDPDAINRGAWSDDFNRVTLESDCATYTQPDVVELRFTVTETQRPGGIFDPCLDLYAYRGETLVRTIREEGCGDPFLAPAAPGRDEAEVRYQLKAFWDLKDEAGEPVPPGAYEIRGRFYLYYDPVVTIGVTVEAPAPE